MPASINLTGAKDYIRRGILKDSTLVVADKTTGALMSVAITNQRLKQLSSKLDLYIKQREADKTKDEHKKAFEARQEATRKRSSSHFMSFDKAEESVDKDGTINKSKEGGFLEHILEFMGMKKVGSILKKGGGALVRSVFKVGKVGGRLAGLVGGIFTGPVGWAIDAGLLGWMAWDFLGDDSKKAVISGVKKSWNSITSFMQTKGADLSTYISKKWDAIKQESVSALTKTSEVLQSGWRSFTDTTAKYAVEMEDWFKKQGTNLNHWFDDIISQLNKYINSFELKKVANDWLSKLSEWVKNYFGLGSSSGGGASPLNPQMPTPQPIPIPTPNDSAPNTPFGGLVTPDSPQWKTDNQPKQPTPRPGPHPQGPTLDGAAPNTPFGGLVTPDSKNWTGTPKPNSPSVGQTNGQYPDWLGPKSRAQMAGVNSELAQDMLDAAKATGINFRVSQGMRTPEEAAANARRGIGVRNSQHLYGAAMDVVIPGGSRADYKRLGDAFEQISRARGHSTHRWLGNSPGRWGRDIYHFDQGIGYGQKHERNPYGAATPQDPATPQETKPKGVDTTGGKQTVPTSANSPLFIGDSIAHRMQLVNHSPDFTRDGQRTPLAVDGEPITARGGRAGILARINGMSPAELKDRVVVLSMGSNQPEEVGKIEDAIKTLVAKGVDPSNIRLVGMSPTKFSAQNDQAAAIAQKYGVQMFGFMPSADGVHPSMGDTEELNRRALAKPVVPSSSDPSAATGLPSYSGTKMVMPKAVNDPSVKPTETTEQPGSPYKITSPQDAADYSNKTNKKSGNVVGENAMDQIPSHAVDPHLLVKNTGDNL